MASRELFIAAARSKIGASYRWGGNGPDYFDCSGYVLYCLRAAGLNFPDMTALSLAGLLLPKRVEKRDALPGDIFFYGKPVIHHVMAVLDRWPDGHLMLAGARGGDEKTIDYEIAYQKLAYVDIVVGDYWNGTFAFAADPFQ